MQVCRLWKETGMQTQKAPRCPTPELSCYEPIVLPSASPCHSLKSCSKNFFHKSYSNWTLWLYFRTGGNVIIIVIVCYWLYRNMFRKIKLHLASIKYPFEITLGNILYRSYQNWRWQTFHYVLRKRNWDVYFFSVYKDYKERSLVYHFLLKQY